jgi:hypothetical protein
VSGANPVVDSRDVHALEALVDKYGFAGLAEMLAEIAEERRDDVARDAFDSTADEIGDEGEED